MTKVEYETESCGRCGGCGRYSFNQIDGDRCFGCGGTGQRLTKRGQAAKAYADSLLQITVEEYHENHQGERAKFVDSMANRWRTFNSSEEREPIRGKSMNREGEMIPFTQRSFRVYRDGKPIMGLGGGIKVRLNPTEEILKMVAEYQDNLTKAGKPRKRKVSK